MNVFKNPHLLGDGCGGGGGVIGGKGDGRQGERRGGGGGPGNRHVQTVTWGNAQYS